MRIPREYDASRGTGWCRVSYLCESPKCPHQESQETLEHAPDPIRSPFSPAIREPARMPFRSPSPRQPGDGVMGFAGVTNMRWRLELGRARPSFGGGTRHHHLAVMSGRIIFGSHQPLHLDGLEVDPISSKLQWRSQSRDAGNSTAQDGRTDAGAAVPGPHLSVPGQERRRPDNTMPKPLTGGRYFAIPIRADVVHAEAARSKKWCCRPQRQPRPWRAARPFEAE
jgi:hypothetical protein